MALENQRTRRRGRLKHAHLPVFYTFPWRYFYEFYFGALETFDPAASFESY